MNLDFRTVGTEVVIINFGKFIDDENPESKAKHY